MDEEVFELVFEGAVDPSPETMRRIKTAFIADLNMSIEQARDLFSGSKSTILRTSDRSLVDSYFDILTKAGGKLLIVQPNAEHKECADPMHKDDEIWQEEFNNADNIVPHVPEGMTNILDLDLGLKETTHQSTLSTKQDPPQNTPDEDDIVSLLESVEEESKPLIPEIKEPEKISVPVSEKKPIEIKEAAASFSFSFADESTGSPEIPPPSPPPQTKTPENKSAIKDFDFTFSDSEEHVEEVVKSAPEVPPPPPAKPKEPSTDISLEEPVTPKVEATVQKQTAQVTEMPSSEAPTEEVKKVVQEESQVDIPRPIRKKQSTLKLYLEIGIPVLLGAGILFIGNWYYFSRTPAAPLPKAESAADILAKKGKAPKKEPTPDPTGGVVNIEGESKDGDINLTGVFVVDKETFKEFSLVLSTKEPPSLTNEQIVNNERRAPWIEKISIDEPDITYEGNGKFRSSTPAKVIIEDNGERSRNVATAELRGMFSLTLNQVIIEVSIKSQIEGGDLANPFIERIDTGGYRFSAHGRLEVKK